MSPTLPCISLAKPSVNVTAGVAIRFFTAQEHDSQGILDQFGRGVNGHLALAPPPTDPGRHLDAPRQASSGELFPRSGLGSHKGHEGPAQPARHLGE